MKINELAENLTYATPAQVKELAANLSKQFPDLRFEPQKKKTSPVTFIRVFGADKKQMVDYFKQFGLDNLPLEPEQAVSGKYRSNTLSYNADNVIYTLVVASSGKKDDEDGVSVSIKEFTPVSLGLAGKIYNRKSLIAATKKAVMEKTKTRPELQAILLGLLDVAETGKGQLSPELNSQLSDRARAQLGVDFGEILAPILIADDEEQIDFPAEGNFPLVDVIVGKRNYSVKSLTGSGTSFRSISNLMDTYENSIGKDDNQKKLFSLFKGFHPSQGGKNVDKLVKAAQLSNIPEYATATRILGDNFESYEELKSLLEKVIPDNSPKSYGMFLNLVYPAMTAGGWDKPVGLPADGKYYMGDQQGPKPVEKEAGYPSFRADPAKAAADIMTYVLGVGTLNAVNKGPDSEKYNAMMTKIVNQSTCYLGKLDIMDNGSLSVASKPFSELQFKFQYHAPSHKPGNNAPGFMIVY